MILLALKFTIKSTLAHKLVYFYGANLLTQNK